MHRALDIAVTLHDELPAADAGLVDTGLGAANEAAAPLHEVRALSALRERRPAP